MVGRVAVDRAHRRLTTFGARAARSQIGRSVVSPQLRQTMSEVSDLRAILEWAPQLGQSERSS